jgi:predicted RNA methylase
MLLGTGVCECVPSLMSSHACIHAVDAVSLSFVWLAFAQHVLRTAASWGAEASVLAEMKFEIPHMHKFHKKKSVDVDVDLVRVAHGVPSHDRK